ncbi:sugar kinase [Nocardiopsis composta]
MNSTAPHAPEAVCLGESLVTFLPSRPGRLADVPSFDRSLGGAESNVACTLAGAGHRTRWVSRVGADGFGDYLVRAVAAYGVDTSAVGRDPHRPTGVYFRTAGERATGPDGGPDLSEVLYYRAGSAASAMSAETVAAADTDAGRVLHLTGITAALSADCLGLLRRLTADRPGRPWSPSTSTTGPGCGPAPRGPGGPARPGPRLRRGVRRRGRGRGRLGVAGGPAAVRAALPEPPVLVVKEGPAGATAFTPQTPGGLFAPAARVDVAAPVGAGDAFAAGFLSATLRGLPPLERLRHGHLFAAAALTVPGDLAAPPSREHAGELAALPDDDWGRLHLGPGWTARAGTPAGKARTP